LTDDVIVEDWDLYEQIVDYLYQDQLRASPKDHPILIAEPAVCVMMPLMVCEDVSGGV